MSNLNDQWRAVVAKAWDDPDFNAMLFANPVGTLRAEGIEIADGVNVQVHQASTNELHLVVPAKPADMTVEEASQALIGDAHPGF